MENGKTKNFHEEKTSEIYCRIFQSHFRKSYQARWPKNIFHDVFWLGGRNEIQSFDRSINHFRLLIVLAVHNRPQIRLEAKSIAGFHVDSGS